MVFWQNIICKWKELQQWKLWNVSGTPNNAPESSIWYDTSEHRAALKDDEKAQHLAHVEDLPNYSGVFTLPTITVGAGGVLTIGSDGYIYAREDANYTGIPKLWNPAGATLNLVSGADQWLVYTAGVGYSLTTINPGDAGLLSNKVPLYRYQYEFGRVHSEDQDQLAMGQSEKNAVRVAFTEFYKRVRETGLELTMSNLLVNISGAYVYRGSVIELVLPFVGGTNQLYRHSIANGTWSEATVAGIDTSIYNPSTGIATLQANKFAWAHVYRSIGNAVEAFVVYGDSYYSTEAAALAGFKLPSALTATIRSHCVRVASVLYQQGQSIIPSTQVYTAWVESTIGSTGIPNHNELGLIDGGDPANNYYGHLSAAQRLLLVNAGAANGVATLDANGKVPSGQLPSYVDDVLEYATKAGFPATGESGKIYVDLSTNLTWRWSGSTYVEISPSLALGETSTTAYRGDRGKIAYDHSQTAHAPANADNTKAALNAASAKTTPVDADVIPILDSAAGNAIKKLSWANIKATLKTYLDTLYSAIGHTHAASAITSTATGDVSATNVQAAIVELASEKLSTSAAASTYQTKLTFDSNPTASSTNPVTSGGVYSAMAGKVSTTRNYWNATYVSDSNRWVKIASITTSDRDYTSHCLFVGKSFYSGQHHMQGLLLIAQNGFNTGSRPVISFVGQQKYAKVYYTFDDAANLLEIYLYLAGGSGDGLPNGITTNILSSTDPSRITLLTSGTTLASVTGAIEVNYLTVNPLDNNTLTNGNLVIGGGNAIIGSTHVGNWSQGSDSARFGHSSHNNATGFGFMQNSAGSASISVPAGQQIYLGVGAVHATRIDANGFLHTNPPALSDDADTVPTTAWVNDALAGKAALSHTHGNLTSDGKIGTTANLPVQTGTGGVVQAGAWYASSPAMDGVASAGSSNSPARGDHVHPKDTSRADLASSYPTQDAGDITGNVTISSAVSGDFHHVAGDYTVTLSNSIAVGTVIYFGHPNNCSRNYMAIVASDPKGVSRTNRFTQSYGEEEHGMIRAVRCLSGWMING